jgi:hypothetical protein
MKIFSELKKFKTGKKRVLVKIAKVLNYFSALMMVCFAGYRFYLFFDADDNKEKGEPLFYVLSFYLLGFATLIFSAEWRIIIVLMYFEMLKGRGGKGLFLILVGLLVFNE